MNGSTETLNRGQIATAEAMYNVFTLNQLELEWLAYFITGDAKVAEACVVDARSLSVSHNQVFEDWLLQWARYATIRSAIQAQRERRMLHGSTYEKLLCEHPSHAPLEASMIEFVVDNAELVIKKLDALSRVAVVVYGIQKNSLAEAALLSEVSRKAMRAAYCTALKRLDVLRCEEMRVDSSSHAPLVLS